MSDAPDRLSPELEAFLAPERQRSDPAPEVQNQVFSRLAVTLGWPGGPGPGPAPGGSDPSGGAAAGGRAAGNVAAHGAKHLATGALMKTVATLVVGGVIGSGVHEAYDRATGRLAEHATVAVVAPPPAAPVPTPVAPPPVAPVVATTPQPPPAPSAVHVKAPPAKPEPRERDRSLAAERALIEQARTALAREQGAAALAALDRHARDFPQGELEEERESLRVQALVALQQFEPARKLGARFHRRFPRSIFGAVVDEALKSIP
jgi:hypothetical protein